MGVHSMGSRTTLTIANGQTASSSVRCDGAVPVAVLWPVAMTSTAATLQVSVDGAAWKTVQKLDGSGDYSITVGANEYQPIDPAVVAGCAGLHVRLVVGSAEGGARSIELVRRPV